MSKTEIEKAIDQHDRDAEGERRCKIAAFIQARQKHGGAAGLSLEELVADARRRTDQELTIAIDAAREIDTALAGRPSDEEQAKADAATAEAFKALKDERAVWESREKILDQVTTSTSNAATVLRRRRENADRRIAELKRVAFGKADTVASPAFSQKYELSDRKPTEEKRPLSTVRTLGRIDEDGVLVASE